MLFTIAHVLNSNGYIVLNTKFNKLKGYFVRPVCRFFRDMRWLALWLPVALMVPNVALSITENLDFLAATANILLPFGVYLILMSAWKRTGGMVLLMLPFMIFAGFQIVLLYLYGGSVIAVDMFLNVVTTNVSEATELLANLLLAMAMVILLYVPAIVWGIVSLCRKQTLVCAFRRKMVRWGAAFAGAGTVAVMAAYAFQSGYNFVYDTFPVNAASNLIEACHRYSETSNHAALAQDFRYSSEATHPADEPEIYMMVIGETSRATNWQLAGYGRPTNPRLSKQEGVVFFPRSISESNTTHKSVPMLMSFACAENFDSIAYYKSILTAFREAGFRTSFISNQQRNRSFTEHFGNEADSVIYLSGTPGEAHPYDAEMIPMVRKIVADTAALKQLIVLHSYGSHFLYRDRYPAEFSFFTPDNAVDASPGRRAELINSYDNSIRYTDAFLSELIDVLRQRKVRGAILYAADHGEDIFDDSRNRFLHASPKPTYWQIHQATLIWLSPELSAGNPEMAAALERNGRERISPQKSLFPTAMQLAGIRSPFVIDSLSLVSPRYSPAPPVYLDDLNRPLPLSSCGLTPADTIRLSPLLR